ncbi:MAG: hypothetical protein ABFR36_06325 [Acidobacteriota bacterium]
MKKLVLLLSILIVLTGIVFSQSIGITFPKIGKTLYKGNTYKITWNNSGCSSPDVKINIFKNSIDTANFVEQLTGPNNGSKSWTIPANYSTGNYILRVKTDPPETGCKGDSEVFIVKKKSPVSIGAVEPKDFKIVDLNISQLKRFIQITSPVNSKSYQVHKSVPINWNKNFGDYEWVWVHAYYIGNSKPVAIIGTLVKNTGVSSWSPTSNYNKNDIYVEIKTSDNKYSGKSQTFKLYYPAVEVTE